MPDHGRFLAFSKPFIEASLNVFETMVFTKIEPQKPSIKKDQTSLGDVSAVMGVCGKVKKEDGETDFKGMLVLSWSFDTYVKIANAMLLESYTEYNKEISDVGAEIANMIVGNAKRDLTGLGYKIDMAIPSIIGGKNHTITYPPGTTVILIPIKSAYGQFYMELCYTD